VKGVVIAIGVLALLSLRASTDDGKDSSGVSQCQTAFRLYNASEVVGFVHVLELLRAGQTDEAIEEMEERQLGQTLAHLRLKDDVVDLRGDSSMSFALETVRRYRSRYPRTHSDPETEKLIRGVLAQGPAKE
jgi:hypothetical protein